MPQITCCAPTQLEMMNSNNGGYSTYPQCIFDHNAAIVQQQQLNQQQGLHQHPQTHVHYQQHLLQSPLSTANSTSSSSIYAFYQRQGDQPNHEAFSSLNTTVSTTGESAFIIVLLIYHSNVIKW